MRNIYGTTTGSKNTRCRNLGRVNTAIFKYSLLTKVQDILYATPTCTVLDYSYWTGILFSPQKRGSMFSPALVWLCVCV